MLEAAQAKTLLQAAVAYAQEGLSIIPCIGKRAAVDWKLFQHVPAQESQIREWAQMRALQNVGIVCGAVSRNLVVIDLDGEAAVDLWTRKWPQMANTWTITSGSGAGRHLYFHADELPPTRRVVNAPGGGNIELRSNGCYVVAPPSIHPDTKHPYIVSCPLPIRRLQTLRPVVTWIKELIGEKHGGTMPPPAQAPRPLERQAPRGIRNPDAWARAALQRECHAVATARPGSRNETLHRAAFKLGQLIGMGLLARGNVEALLLTAAADLIQTDGERTVLKTIHSGLEAGTSKPNWRSGT